LALGFEEKRVKSWVRAELEAGDDGEDDDAWDAGPATSAVRI
jgi:hypothetical protein